MKILGLDFESQHDDPYTTPITEIGAVLVEWDPSVPFWAEQPFTRLERYSQLVYHPGYPPQTPEIVELTGITDELLKAEGILPLAAMQGLLPLVEQADIVLAHNKKFDQNVFESICKRMLIPFPEKEWLCTLTDIQWAKKYTCKKLAHLAFEHRMEVDLDNLHRAVNDVDLMLALVFRHYDFTEILKWAREPWVFLAANILGPWNGPGGDGGIGKAQASKLGYNWEKARHTDTPMFPKRWVKRVKASQVESEKALAPFQVDLLG